MKVHVDKIYSGYLIKTLITEFGLLKFHSGFIKHNILTYGFSLNDCYVDVEKSGTIAISGLDSYHETKKISRLSYAKPGVEPKEIQEE